QRAKSNYSGMGVNIDTKITKGNAAYEICNEAKNGRYDLIIMANRGLGEIKGYLLGSVSNRVVRHAGCSVLIIK
ncbi:MAG: universal stress protein, partial [Firmicutes bacterium]|nr:universal stress protein [Bacillota bacterium]